MLFRLFVISVVFMALSGCKDEIVRRGYGFEQDTSSSFSPYGRVEVDFLATSITSELDNVQESQSPYLLRISLNSREQWRTEEFYGKEIQVIFIESIRILSVDETLLFKSAGGVPREDTRDWVFNWQTPSKIIHVDPSKDLIVEWVFVLEIDEMRIEQPFSVNMESVYGEVWASDIDPAW